MNLLELIFNRKFCRHKWYRWNKTTSDCFRKCGKCNKVQYLYPSLLDWRDYHNQQVNLSKFIYLGKQ